VATGLGLESEAVDDGVTMVSELAANTLHVQQRRSAPANPELWLYLRGSGPHAELVCKVFDTLPGWVRGNVPGPAIARAPADAMSGRGLEVVHELSAGRWGHHLSRARLAGTALRGKAVWFALPAPVADRDAGRVTGQGHPATAGQAMTELEKDLGPRGFAGKLVRADDPGADMAVLSIASGLTLWCRSGTAWLRAPGTAVRQWGYCDLVEVAEQAVQEYETTISMVEPSAMATATRTGALVTCDACDTTAARSAGRRRRPWKSTAAEEPSRSVQLEKNFNPGSFFSADRGSYQDGSWLSSRAA
jgi:hypothetical protein